MPRRFAPLPSAVAVVAIACATPLPAARIEGGEIRLDAPIVFQTGGAELKPESDAALAELKEFLAQKPTLTSVRIEGHVADGAPEEERRRLARGRAYAVATWLVQHGIECTRLVPVGFGSSKPAADPTTPDGRAKNTRIVVAPAALRGKPIGGMPVDGGGESAGDPCSH